MKRHLAASLATLATFLAGPAIANSFDGSQPFICSALEMYGCGPGSPCETETADDIDAPHFLNVSVTDKKITGTRPDGGAIDAQIELVRHSRDMMLLLGTQEEFGWNMTINEVDGHMVLTLADDEDGVVIIGVCTTH